MSIVDTILGGSWVGVAIVAALAITVYLRWRQISFTDFIRSIIDFFKNIKEEIEKP